jgi:hypothetical protein
MKLKPENHTCCEKCLREVLVSVAPPGEKVTILNEVHALPVMQQTNLLGGVAARLCSEHLTEWDRWVKDQDEYSELVESKDALYSYLFFVGRADNPTVLESRLEFAERERERISELEEFFFDLALEWLGRNDED